MDEFSCIFQYLDPESVISCQRTCKPNLVNKIQHKSSPNKSSETKLNQNQLSENTPWSSILQYTHMNRIWKRLLILRVTNKLKRLKCEDEATIVAYFKTQLGIENIDDYVAIQDDQIVSKLSSQLLPKEVDWFKLFREDFQNSSDHKTVFQFVLDARENPVMKTLQFDLTNLLGGTERTTCNRFEAHVLQQVNYSFVEFIQQLNAVLFSRRKGDLVALTFLRWIYERDFKPKRTMVQHIGEEQNFKCRPRFIGCFPIIVLSISRLKGTMNALENKIKSLNLQHCKIQFDYTADQTALECQVDFYQSGSTLLGEIG